MNKMSLEPENDRNAPKTKIKITKIPHNLKMTKIPLKCKKWLKYPQDLQNTLNLKNTVP